MAEPVWAELKYEDWGAPAGWYFQQVGYSPYYTWPYYDSGCLAARRDHATYSHPVQGHAIFTSYPCLPNIRIENNVKINYDGSAAHYDYFRAQAYPPPGYSHPNDCYYLTFYLATVSFHYVVSGSSNLIAYHNFSPALSSMTFYKYRFSLWKVDATHDGYKCELWETDHWTTYLEGTCGAHWQGSATNYYGTFLNAGSHWNEINIWIDDLYIYAGGGGFLWVEGTKLAYTDLGGIKRATEGTLTGVTGKIAGHGSVDGTYLVYVDANGAVRREQGTLTGLTGKLPSQISINTAQGGTKFCYIDSSGNERCFEGTA